MNREEKQHLIQILCTPEICKDVGITCSECTRWILSDCCPRLSHREPYTLCCKGWSAKIHKRGQTESGAVLVHQRMSNHPMDTADSMQRLDNEWSRMRPRCRWKIALRQFP